MQPDEGSRELRAARAVLAKLDPEWPGESGVATPGRAPAAADDEPRTEMLATIEALRGWQASLAELPPVEVPRRAAARPFPSWRTWGMSLAAAAVLVLAVGIWFTNQVQQQVAHQQMPPPAGKAIPEPETSQEPKTGGPPTIAVPPTKSIGSVPPTTTFVSLADSARWLATAPLPEVIGKGGVQRGGDGSEGGFGNPKDPPGGGSKPGSLDGGKIGGGSKSGGGGKIGAPAGDPARKFLGELEFAVRVPESLPGDWRFFRGKALSPARAQLTYAKAGKVLSILCWFEAGPDEGPVEQALDGGRHLTVLRRGKLCVAVEGEDVAANADKIARDLQPRE